MKHLLLFENYTSSLNIGDYTNLGIIDDKTDMQYSIDGTWYHYSLVSSTDSSHDKKEQVTKQKLLVVVDVQPDYKKYIGFSLKEFRKYVTQFSDVLFLYNGAQTVGEIDEYEYKEWLINIGFKESFLEECAFIDKGYGFYRSFMDMGVNESDILKLLRYMHENNLNDSRDIEEEDLESIGLEDLDDVRDKWESDMLSIPELMSDLDRQHKEIELIGGGENECLKEVEYCLIVLNKKYSLNRKFIY